MGKESRHDEYLEKAKRLTKDEVEHLFSRMRGRYSRKLEHSKISPLEAVAHQLEYEDECLREWRERVSELRQASKK